jgi:hypothetical protein
MIEHHRADGHNSEEKQAGAERRASANDVPAVGAEGHHKEVTGD